MSSFESVAPDAGESHFVAEAAVGKDRDFRPLPEPRSAESAEADARAEREAPAPREPAAEPGPEEAQPAAAEDPTRAAYAEGLAAGRAELPWKEAEALTHATEALGSLCTELAALKGRYLAVNRRAAIDLAIAIAERIVGRELSSHPDALASVVERAFAELGEEAPVCVHLSARDHEVVRAGEAPALESAWAGREIRIEVDDSLEPGDVRVECASTQVDARRSELLRRVREALDAAPPEPEVAT